MKVFLVAVCSMLILNSCNRQSSSAAQNAGSQEAVSALAEDDSKTTPAVITQETEGIIPEREFVPSIEPREEKLEYGGTGYITEINADNVNVRKHPSLNSEVLFQLSSNRLVTVIGVSKEKETIDGYEGRWLKVFNTFDRYAYMYNENVGWVFSKYVENGDFPVSEIQIIEMPIPEDHRVQTLIASYSSENEEKQARLYPQKQPGQDFFTFVWSIDVAAFYYSCIPGTYVWNPDNGELKHITYIVSTMESRGVFVTDDFEYALQDSGTSPGRRRIQVFRIADGSEIFSGSYYRDFHLTGHTIEIVYSKNTIDRGRQKSDDPVFDKEIRDYFATFESKVILPDGVSKTSNEQIIICRLNLDTLEQKILRGEYMGTQ
jgi:hypothetical protein